MPIARVCRALVPLIVIAAPAAPAQTHADTARLPDLEVTATRVPASASMIPAATTVIQGADLRERGVHFVLDALREVPGLVVIQSGSYGASASVFLRGGESDDVKVLLDGVPLNLPGGALNFANLTTDDLDRIEIVRGATSVLYGSDAMSGVIQLFTRGATDHGSVVLTGRGGTFGTSDLSSHVDLRGRVLSASATGSRFATDGNYPFNDGYDNRAGTVRISADGNRAGQADFTLRYGNATAHFPTDGGGAFIDHNQFTTEHTLAMSLTGSHPISRMAAVRVEGYASRLDEGYTNRADTPADTNGFDYVDDRTGVTWRRGLDARVDWRVARFGLVTAGGGLERETDDEHEIGVSNFGYGASTDTSAFQAHRTTRDGYLEYLGNPARTVTVQLGGRVDDNTAFGSFATWHGGVSYAPHPGTRVWANVGNAFKAPTFSQLFASTAYEVGNPALLPERSRNQEFGAQTGSADGRVTLGVTAFWQQFRDLIQYIGAAPGDPTYTNLGGADARGVEFTLGLALTGRLRVSGNLTHLRTEVTDTGAASSLSFAQGSPLLRRPATSGSATLRYRWHGVSVAVTETRVGDRADVDYSGSEAARVILPGYATVDVAAELPVRRAAGRSPGLDLTFRAENLFDRVYQETVGFPGRGRTVLAGATLQF